MPMISIRGMCSVVWLFCFSLQAAEVLQASFDGQTLKLTTDEGLVTLTAYQGSTFEVLYQVKNEIPLPSFAISEQAVRENAKYQEGRGTLTLTNGQLSAKIQKSPLQISYFRNGQLLLAEEKGAFLQQTLRGFRFNLQAQEKLLGGGQRVLGMDRRGQRLPLYNRAHYGYGTESKQMYYSLPMVLSSHQYILAFDNVASGQLDLGHSETDILQFEAAAGRLGYLVTTGNDFGQLIEHFTAVTGRQPMPPRWALGNYASRFGYRSEAQTRQVVEMFRTEDIPLDAVVLDLYWFGKDIKGMMGNLDWDRQAFPQPEKMMADFAADGVKTILITEPFVLTTSDKWQEAVDAGALAENLAGQPKRFDFYFGNTGLIDVFDPKAQDWFWQTYNTLLGQGVSGWWGDLGEPEVHPADTLHRLADGRQVSADEIHNAYGHQWAKMLFERHRQARPEERPFIMMRSGFVGSQRYGMIPWTGDVSRAWDGLKPQVELSLSMGLQGLAYTHSDLGGFAGGDEFDAELYTRWLQYGVFQPVYRPHAQEHIAPEPVFHDETTKAIVRDFIKLRYALLPYNYSLSYLNSQTGMPLMRPLFLESGDMTQFNNTSSYLWGDAFLVTPVVEPGVNKVEVELPEGVWFDYFSGQRFEGGQGIQLATSLRTLPVLVRGGAFVPMIAPPVSTQAYDSSELILHYYADELVPQGQGLMYDDDGQSFDAVGKKQYELLHFNAQQQGNRLALQLKREAYAYQGMPEQRSLYLHIHNWSSQPRSVTLNNEVIPMAANQGKFDALKQGAWLDGETLKIKLEWALPTLELNIQ
ncbi:glycoside hydrolase family 31 protein [Bowmanella pacifica]|nr:TIM-barrel domain-containing protein [Bowmanella pacifica]